MIKVCSTYSSVQLMISHCGKLIFKSQHFNFASSLQFVILECISLKKKVISVYSIYHILRVVVWVQVVEYTTIHSQAL